MKIRPLSDKILVERVAAENKTSGGIVLPDTAREKPKMGKVIGVGRGKLLENGTVQRMDVSKGDLVLFSTYAGTELKIEGKEYLILNEFDILGIVA